MRRVMKVAEEPIDTLSEYLARIVDPTFAEFQRNPQSARHAFLACVAIFHSVDRLTHHMNRANLRKEWRKQSIEFCVVDIFAHRLKHVRLDGFPQFTFRYAGCHQVCAPASRNVRPTRRLAKKYTPHATIVDTLNQPCQPLKTCGVSTFTSSRTATCRDLSNEPKA